MSDKFQVLFDKKNLEASAIKLFETVESILISTISNLNISLWAMQPIYELEGKAIIIIPFKNHINIMSNRTKNEKAKEYKSAVFENINEIKKYYKVTPKGMIQIFLEDEIKEELLKKVFIDTFLKSK